MLNSWPAYYLDGQTATRHGITVTVTAQALHLIFDSGEIRQWPYRQICQTQGIFQDEPVRFEKSAETIIFASPAILTAIHKALLPQPYIFTIRRCKTLVFIGRSGPP